PVCASPSGLVSWWPGEGNATDIVGGNDGTWSGPADFRQGTVGLAFGVGGNGAGVVVGNPTTLQLQDFTIEAWINRYSASMASLGALGYGAILSYGNGGYALRLADDGRLMLSKVGISTVASSNVVNDV